MDAAVRDKPGVADWLNEQMQEIAGAAGPLAVVPGATTHPGEPDPTIIVRRAVEELGARVLKLHCSVGDFDADDDRLEAVWAYVEEIRLPVVVHVGHAMNGQTDGAELAPIRTVAGRHPGAVVIVAHCAFPAVEAALDAVEAHENVYADLTPVISEGPIISQARWPNVGEKLLFGSDAPNTAISSGEHLAHVRAQCDTDARHAWVTGGLARALIAATIR